MTVNETRKHNWILIPTIIVVVSALAVATLHQTGEVDAYSLDNEGPERIVTLNISYTTYEWWLLSWSNSQVVCQVYIEHEGWPKSEEVQYYCGDQVLETWLSTDACEYSDHGGDSSQCSGLYLHLANITPGQREIEIELVPPEVYIDIVNCDPQPPENRCEIMPSLHLVAEEPLPNESIISIQGYIGNQPFSCEGDECTVPLPATGENGTQVTFWAESSFGDSSEVFTAQIRVIPWGDFAAPDVEPDDDPQWYVDVLSSQYLGEIESTCSQIWSAFPPVGGPPTWLSTPNHPDGLFSDQKYYYLAGNLINQGLVDASGCPDGGLETASIANQCGVEMAHSLISEWQNQFNNEIIKVANDTGVPAQLMKNIFSRESQFWPGFSSTYAEAGLGHLSDLGADVILLWNPSFYSQFCPLILDTSVCQKGFGNLDITEQEMLRGALVQKVNAACPECPMGIDLSQANFSISIFARSLLANCEQVGQVIYNITRQSAGEVSTYEDLWRFTLVNYNAGSGCLSDALNEAFSRGYPLTWENVTRFLEPGCQAAIDYVEDISAMQPESSTASGESTQVDPITPTPTPTEEAYP